MTMINNFLLKIKEVLFLTILELLPTVSKGTDFILPGGDNSFLVIPDPFVVDITVEGSEIVVTDHQFLPAAQYKGVLP